MFNSITFFNQNKTDTSRPLDIGQLVECMLFYGKTTIIANQGILRQLFSQIGINNVIELIELELLEIIYTESGLGIHTSNRNNREHFNAINYSSPQHTYQIEIVKICTDITGKTGKGRRSALKFRDLIKVVNYEDEIIQNAKETFLDQAYINQAAKNVLQTLIPEQINLENLVFNTDKNNNGLIVDTNINFHEINKIYHKYVPITHSSLSAAYILSHTLYMESEIHFSSKTQSELATSPLSSKLISQKVNHIIDKSTQSSDKISDFQNFIFNDAKCLREAINKKQIEFTDVLTVLKKSQKFKKWIINVEPDSNLIKKYYDEVTKETIVDKLPGKSVRWGLFTGAGFIADLLATGGLGTTIGLGLSALDAFYLDKLISGWKPNQFIEGDLKNLIEKSRGVIK